MNIVNHRLKITISKLRKSHWTVEQTMSFHLMASNVIICAAAVVHQTGHIINMDTSVDIIRDSLDLL